MNRIGYWFSFQTPIAPFVAASLDNQILCAIFSSNPNIPLKRLKSYTDVTWIQECNETLSILEMQIEEYFKRDRQQFNLPLKISGTSFQKQCWDYLQTIPYGKTVSYSDQAFSIQNLKAVRACGSANGKNPFHIIIPCHRVISKQGHLGGYSEGLEIKQYLLELEKSSLIKCIENTTSFIKKELV